MKLSEVTKAKLLAGQIVGKENSNGIVVAKWRDKRDVTMLSTCHNLNMVDTGKKNRKNEAVVKPIIIIDYNTGKAGIDLSDQLSSYSSPVRKSIRWYHKVATEIILGTSVVNAFIIYNTKTPQNKMSITQFREALVDQILGLDQPKSILEQITPPRSLITLKHKFQETSEKCSRNHKIRKRCTHCYKERKENAARNGLVQACKDTKRVTTLCTKCEVYTCSNCFSNIIPSKKEAKAEDKSIPSMNGMIKTIYIVKV